MSEHSNGADRFDVIILGSGAGGGTMAHALSSTGARVLLVERGEPVPQEAENWDPAAVWRDKRYRADEQWLDSRGKEFRPFMHYVVGGNTKFWGSVLYRLRRIRELLNRDPDDPEQRLALQLALRARHVLDR